MSKRLVSQRALPGATRLYGDYLYEFARVGRWYPGGAAFDFDRLAAAARRVDYDEARREGMARVLRRQNPAHPHLDLFARAGTVVVVTGQQVGLLGGPLLGFLKAMTAVLVAEGLRARGVAAVPVFWLATQDHDLAEIDHAWCWDAQGRPQRVAAQLEAPAGARAASARLPADFAAPLASAYYRPGAAVGASFAGLMQHWFAPCGLLTFDPSEAPEADAIWQPYYLAAFDRREELASRLAARAAELEAAGYHAQVEQTAAASMLFLDRDGARLGLRQQEGRWLLGEAEVAAGKTRAQIAERPGTVSPAALLRPVLQDVAFPVVAQVTGPAETAYLAQSEVLYAALGVARPVAWPRVSATLVDAKCRRLLEKYRLTAEELWREPASELLAKRALPPGVERQAGVLREHFEQDAAALARQLSELDPTLVDATNGAAQKIRHQLEQLEARVARSFARRNEEIAGQADYLAGRLFPERTLQERLLAAAAFLEPDPGLAARLHDELEATVADHQLIEI